MTALLSAVEQRLKIAIGKSDFPFPEQAFLKAGKISRGEQYQGLPYWVLDYPRKFSKEGTFSFRTMIWWGHEASCFLHIGGKDLEKFRSFILKNFKNDPEQFAAIGPSPWAYHFDVGNYKKTSKISPEAIQEHMNKFQFHKMIYPFPLKQLAELPDFATDTFAKTLTNLQ